ncbi:MAG: phosphoglycerate kinase, partial [Deltaproteobacteria bacterium]
KYGIDIAGVAEEDIDLALELVRLDKEKNKIVELPLLVESENLGQRKEGKTKTIAVKDFRQGNRYSYILDADPDSFHQRPIPDIISSAKTILVNAVMGLTPHFSDGSMALYEAIDENRRALKLYGEVILYRN